MKYLRIFEEFDTWEKITADQWYSTFTMENKPFDENEYETLLDFCFDNANYEKGENEYEIDYDYVNPNKMDYNGNMERAWRFTMLKFKISWNDTETRRYLQSDTTIHLFKKEESKGSNNIYFLTHINDYTDVHGFYECDTFKDLLVLAKKHLEL
jgi:hypothetical protein